jgi:hypothetical protein
MQWKFGICELMERLAEMKRQFDDKAVSKASDSLSEATEKIVKVISKPDNSSQ